MDIFMRAEIDCLRHSRLTGGYHNTAFIPRSYAIAFVSFFLAAAAVAVAALFFYRSRVMDFHCDYSRQ